MCLILFGIDASPDFPFILAANRDEFYARPTRPMEFWTEHQDILAGKDLEAGGTWFGVSARGRFAALTNYRDLSTVKPQGPSRGKIIPEFLAYQGSVRAYLKQLDKTAESYSGFNLLAGEAGQVYCYSNINKETTSIGTGIHGLSNRFLDTPWPKVTRGRERLATLINKNLLDDETMFDMLADTTRPNDAHLPDTGVGIQWERILSPLFIQSPTYGTRSSTLMRINRAGEIKITERTWGAGPGEKIRDRTFTLP